jgi:hypothetical protein
MAFAATTQRQRSPTIATMSPPAAGPEGMLAATCTLLHNPPGPDASPEVAEQWRNDIDQLIVAMINMSSYRRLPSHHSDGTPAPSLALSCTSTTARTPSTARASTASRRAATSLATTNLGAELDCHSVGEDGWTTIEHLSPPALTSRDY